MNKEALSKFAKRSGRYSEQMTEAWKKMVEKGQYPISKEALGDIGKSEGHVKEYLIAFENWRSLQIPS